MACLSYLPQLIFIFLIHFVLFTFMYRKRCFIKKKYEVKKIEKCIAKLFYFKLVLKTAAFCMQTWNIARWWSSSLNFFSHIFYAPAKAFCYTKAWNINWSFFYRVSLRFYQTQEVQRQFYSALLFSHKP